MAVCVSDNLLGNTADPCQAFLGIDLYGHARRFLLFPLHCVFKSLKESKLESKVTTTFSVFKLGNFRTSLLLEKLPIHWEQQTYVTFLCAALL